MKKNIVVIAMGGTIASGGTNGESTNYKLGVFRIEELLSAIPDTSDIAHITGEQFLNIQSSELTLSNLIALSNRINTLLSQDNVDGIVITHGTDTMEETAYFLNLTIKSSKPVVMTGAMRPATAAGADGQMNLFQAIVAASSNNCTHQGVLLVFADCIYNARDVQKVSPFRLEAFSGKDFGAIGHIRDTLVDIVHSSNKKHTLSSPFDVSNIKNLPNVPIAYFCSGADIDWLKSLSKGADGIVIAGAGHGNMSKEWRAYVSELTKRGIPVVRATRTSSGIVSYESRHEMEMNTIPSLSLPPTKARILLMLALTQTKDFHQIRQYFSTF